MPTQDTRPNPWERRIPVIGHLEYRLDSDPDEFAEVEVQGCDTVAMMGTLVTTRGHAEKIIAALAKAGIGARIIE